MSKQKLGRALTKVASLSVHEVAKLYEERTHKKATPSAIAGWRPKVGNEYARLGITIFGFDGHKVQHTTVCICLSVTCTLNPFCCTLHAQVSIDDTVENRARFAGCLHAWHGFTLPFHWQVPALAPARRNISNSNDDRTKRITNVNIIPHTLAVIVEIIVPYYNEKDGPNPVDVQWLTGNKVVVSGSATRKNFVPTTCGAIERGASSLKWPTTYKWCATFKVPNSVVRGSIPIPAYQEHGIVALKFARVQI